MANIKSAKKRAKQSIVKRERNLARKTAIKSGIKKIITLLEAGDITKSKEELKDVQAKLARAKGKGVLHANTAARKLSRLAKKVAAAERATA